ncbi:MAG: hypothetical protein RLY56_1693 [Pseudomonadota bacterium]
MWIHVNDVRADRVVTPEYAGVRVSPFTVSPFTDGRIDASHAGERKANLSHGREIVDQNFASVDFDDFQMR